MIKFKVPATSANLGPGFDCLGLALSIQNEYAIKKSKTLIIDAPITKYNKKNNLFNIAFVATMKKLKKTGSFYVKYVPTIPLSGGLGSSASAIVAGCLTANMLYGNNKLSKQDIFEIATQIEGHPDNVAPALFGGLTASIQLDNGYLYHKKYKVSNKLYFSILYPDYHIITSMARKVLPKKYLKKDAVKNISHSILMVEALQNGDFDLLKTVSKDYIHEPYRKKLISDYDVLKTAVEQTGDSILLISGSGATLLVISKKKNFSKHFILPKTKANWTYQDVKILSHL